MAEKLIVREWFSRILKNLPKNASLTVAKRQALAEKELPSILARSPRGLDWQIFQTHWQSPKPRKKGFRMTVLIKEKKNHPPDDVKVPPKPRTPPPSM